VPAQAGSGCPRSSVVGFGALPCPASGFSLSGLLLALGGSSFGFTWAARVVRLVVSPLWFLSVYLALVALLPLTLWLHRRYGVAVLPWLAGLAVCVDILRFGYHIDQAAWANLLIVWGLAHQVGFGHRAIVDAGRRCAWTLLVSGLAGLAVAIVVCSYPASMVGVLGDRFSNMAPPTFAVAALAAVQIGIAAVLRPLGESDF
jgi:peptidoglycan/LPS O-acetylase OafA/YrhL